MSFRLWKVIWPRLEAFRTARRAEQAELCAGGRGGFVLLRGVRQEIFDRLDDTEANVSWYRNNDATTAESVLGDVVVHQETPDLHSAIATTLTNCVVGVISYPVFLKTLKSGLFNVCNLFSIKGKQQGSLTPLRQKGARRAFVEPLDITLGRSLTGDRCWVSRGVGSDDRVVGVHSRCRGRDAAAARALLQVAHASARLSHLIRPARWESQANLARP